MLDGSSSMRSHDARAVSVIDIEVGFIVPGQPTEFWQWREVSVHTEQTVGHNKGAPPPAFFGKKGLEVVDIVVAINTKVGCAETAAVDQAGMAQTIGQDQSALFAQCWDGSNVGKVARAKGQGGFGSFEVRQGSFQLLMRRQRP